MPRRSTLFQADEKGTALLDRREIVQNKEKNDRFFDWRLRMEHCCVDLREKRTRP